LASAPVYLFGHVDAKPLCRPRPADHCAGYIAKYLTKRGEDGAFGATETAASAIGESGPPYDLRHSFASLLIHEGRTALEVAAQLGDSVEVLLGVYAQVFAEIGPSTSFMAADAIEAARAEFGVREMYADLGLLDREESRDPASEEEADAGTRTPDPIITSEGAEAVLLLLNDYLA